MDSVLKKILLKISEYLEIILAIFMVVVLVLVICRSIVTETPRIFTEGTSIHHFLEGSLNLAIAIEFVKLLCMHTPGTLIEVLMFANARHMIVEHLTPVQNLIIVGSIAILFVIRRYLLTSHDQKGMSEHANGTKGIVEDLLKARREKSALTRYVEGTREEKRLQRNAREIKKRENAEAGTVAGSDSTSAHE